MAKGKRKKQEESYLSYYTIIEELGEGGNAHVYKAYEKISGKEHALKVLEKRTEEAESRFREEIYIMKTYAKAVPGILPIYRFDEVNCWYSMPIAQNVIDKVSELTLELDRYTISRVSNVLKTIDVVISLSNTLEFLHSKGVSHRDIKPDNIYVYEGIPCLGDFGLVSFPDSDFSFTKTDKGIGAIFTIAPEMKRDPKNADGLKADVYSMAKMLWMLLTCDVKGFDGQYNCVDEFHSLHSYPSLRREYLVEVERLLKIATDSDPQKRPTISEFKDLSVYL